jgi:hypothetical protein
MYTNITNLNDPASDDTPITFKIQANTDINQIVKKRTDYNKFRSIMTTNSFFNIKFKNSEDIDNAISTLTKNIQNTIQISTTIY